MIDPAFTGRLLPGETIVWSGRPGQGIVFTSRDIFLIPFSLLWAGIVITITFANRRVEAGPSGVFSLLFAAVGVYSVAGRFLVDAWLRRTMCYALTDRRILIVRGAPFAKFTAVSLVQLPEADLAERTNGRGTIRFGAASSLFGGRSQGIWSPALDPTPQFIAINDARKVFDLVQRTGAARRPV